MVAIYYPWVGCMPSAGRVGRWDGHAVQPARRDGTSIALVCRSILPTGWGATSIALQAHRTASRKVGCTILPTGWGAPYFPSAGLQRPLPCIVVHRHCNSRRVTRKKLVYTKYVNVRGSCLIKEYCNLCVILDTCMLVKLVLVVPLSCYY